MGVSAGFGAMAAMSAVNSYNTANAQKNQATFTASQFEANKKIATAQADTARAQGDLNASAMDRQTKANVAHQRVAEAATGADTSSGSALLLQSDTRWQGAQNEVMIKNNAWRSAWGYGIEAENYGSEAQFTEIAGDNQYRNTLLTGGMQAIGYGVQAGNSYNMNNGSRPAPGGGTY